LNNIPLIENKNNQICYFGCIERGYKMAVEIVKQLDSYQLISNTYYSGHRSLFSIENENKISITNNSAKYTIFKSVSESKYFVYPLINLDNNKIHYDTFGYVVLEALLLGCIVIVPKIKVYEELYGDAICYIETDDIIPNEDLLYWKKDNHNFGFPILNRYIEKIKLLDENEELRKTYIEKGLLLREKFCNKKIANEFVSYLQNNLKLHLEKHLTHLSHLECIPMNHVNYLQNLKSQGFEPKVIYDIGSCVLHWTKEAKKLWPDAKYILFDAFSPAEFLYKEYGYDYYISVLSDEDDKIIKFYQNDYLPGGNSYYREIGCENGKYFPEDKYIEKVTKTINTIVKERQFPLPDLVKIDVQGAEVDIIKGGIDTFKNASRMIVELQDTEYNQGALKKDISLPLIENLLGFKCTDPLFQNNGPDGDYGFINPAKIN
jgi:FkbM family methyltransferase